MRRLLSGPHLRGVCSFAILTAVVLGSAGGSDATGVDTESGRPDSAVLSLGPETIAQVRDYVAEQRRIHDLPGLSVGIVHGPDVVFLEGFGDERLGEVPMTEDSRVVIASLSKSITAMALMVAVDRGLVELDDPASLYFPEWGEDGAGVTLRQFMHHRSGISGYRGNAAFVGSLGESLQANVAGIGAFVAPDAGFEYSNSNYDVLAMVIERVSGMPFSQFVAENVFEPLQMTRSEVGRVDDPSGSLATGYYHRLAFGYGEHVPWLPDGMSGSYMMVSTAADLSRFMVAHLSSETGGAGSHVVSPESLAVLHESSQYGPESFSVGYAGGFNVLPAHGFPCEDGRAACGFTHLVHDGSSPSYRSYMAMTPELGLGIVTLANANNVADESLVPQINRNISYLLYGESPRDIVVFSDPLIRWGKHLIALVVVAQLILAGLTARRIKRSQPGYNRGRWALFGLATTVDLIALATIFVVIPVAAESPLGVTFSLPDYRLLIIAMGVGIAWGVVRSYLIVRHLSRTPR